MFDGGDKCEKFAWEEIYIWVEEVDEDELRNDDGDDDDNDNDRRIRVYVRNNELTDRDISGSTVFSHIYVDVCTKRDCSASPCTRGFCIAWEKCSNNLHMNDHLPSSLKTIFFMKKRKSLPTTVNVQEHKMKEVFLSRL